MSDTKGCDSCKYHNATCPPQGEFDTECNWVSAFHKWEPKYTPCSKDAIDAGKMLDK